MSVEEENKALSGRVAEAINGGDLEAFDPRTRSTSGRSRGFSHPPAAYRGHTVNRLRP